MGEAAATITSPIPILRGNLYWAVTPFGAEEPVQVFHPHPLESRVGVTGPDPLVFESGGEHPVVLNFKTRPILILQNDKGNASPVMAYSIVALAYCFEKEEVGTPRYNEIKNWHNPFTAYISPGIINTRDGYVNLGNILLLHKSMIKAPITTTTPFSPQEWEHIHTGLYRQFSLPGPNVPAARSSTKPLTSLPKRPSHK